MTINEYHGEVAKVKAKIRTTKCPHCLIMMDQYIAHMNKILDMIGQSEKTIQYALIDLDNHIPAMAIDNAKDRLTTLLSGEK